MDDAALNALVEPPAREVAPGAPPGPATSECLACFHCGEPCADATFARKEKIFCCQGCLTVHELLTESGLSQFYELSTHPGVKVRKPAKPGRFAYLDQASVQERLLDFTDGNSSRVTLHIPAIHCVACVWLLENLFQLHPGVGPSRVNFGRRDVSIAFQPGKIALSELVGLLSSLGYEPSLTLGELEKPGHDSARKRQWLQLGIAGFGFGNIMLLSLPLYLGLDSFSAPLFRGVFAGLALALAAPVMIFSAADYWRSALASLRASALTLDVPIALGLGALYGWSAYEILSGQGAGYLDSLTGLVFFLLCGRAFQQHTYDRLAFDRDYRSFFPLAVTRKTVPLPGANAGASVACAEQSVAISELKVGDRIVVRNGELLPADAHLLEGTALIDYSFVSGEAEPVGKQTSDYLYAGGRQVGGAIELEIVKPVSQSYLASLWDHETFRKERADSLSSLTNRYSRRFTLAVLVLALGTALGWAAAGRPAVALRAAISVLIVACPCALALAAPFTLGTAQRLLARSRAFTKNTLTLERMAQVDTIVFDKTGTLTAGNTNPAALAQVVGPPLSEAERRWVFSLARQSTHPLSLRLMQWLEGPAGPEPVAMFLETPGCGTQGRVCHHEIRLGSRAWLEQAGLAVPEVEVSAHSLVYLAIDGKYRCAFSLGHRVRPETDRLLHELATTYELALLSGDNERERERFRALLGPGARLCFNQSPLGKLGFIEGLQKTGRTVMMVGDGLNDAGALKQADVGIAVVESVGAFSPASDVILAADQVPSLSRILRLARKAARIVRLNFGLSALYNVAGISIAASGALSPLVCAILMPLSSVSVVLLACGATNRAAKCLKLTDQNAETRQPSARSHRPEPDHRLLSS